LTDCYRPYGKVGRHQCQGDRSFVQDTFLSTIFP